jgi:hypothetical protein
VERGESEENTHAQKKKKRHRWANNSRGSERKERRAESVGLKIGGKNDAQTQKYSQKGAAGEHCHAPFVHRCVYVYVSVCFVCVCVCVRERESVCRHPSAINTLTKRVCLADSGLS